MRRLALVCLVLAASLARGAEPEPLVSPAHRLAADDPAWRELAGGLRGPQAITATFTENRWFPFKKTPTVLKGESRVAAGRGLSLHYVSPEELTTIIDAQGMLLRTAKGDTAGPADPPAVAANRALLHVLALDLPALTGTFELYGERTGTKWKLALLPREASLRRTLGQISIEGDGAAVRRIELRRSAVQRVEILIDPPEAGSVFSAEVLRRYFR
jgi:hypothetical protein